jgi:hypothetical protein
MSVRPKLSLKVGQQDAFFAPSCTISTFKLFLPVKRWSKIVALPAA